MCGIVGFTGNQQAAPILLDGLSNLEYRGYDSSGIAVRDGEAKTEGIKEKSKFNNLIRMTMISIYTIIGVSDGACC